MEISKEIVTLVLGTGLVSAFITALFSKFQSDKNHKIENITKERKEWRDCIRRIVLDVVEACQNEDADKLHGLEAELRVRLNPNDKSDKKILVVISGLRTGGNENNSAEDKLTEFCDRISYLLKHDWERVKKETATSISILNILYALFFSIVTLFFLGMPFGMDLEFIDSGILLIIFLFLICCIELFKYQPKYDGTFKLSNIFSSRNKFK